MVFVWVLVPAFVSVLGSHIADIIKGTCVPWGVFRSYAAEKGFTAVLVIGTYLLPVTLTVMCYCRIVYALRFKASRLISTLTYDDCSKFCCHLLTIHCIITVLVLRAARQRSTERYDTIR